MCLGKLRILTHFSTKTEVPQFYVIVLVDENVCGFDIPVEYFSAFALLVRGSGVAVLKS
jgi:hypothetical protein